MKSIWKGTLSFGLVSIPVKLFSAVNDSSLDFDMLDRRDHEKIRFVRVNEKTENQVLWEDIIKAYNYEGEYITLEDEDFKAAAPEKTENIDIAEFVLESEIDSMFYEQPYYLEPDKGGAKAYNLFAEALKKSGKAGLSLFVMRTKENLALITVRGKYLVLIRLRFPQELRDIEQVKVPEKQSLKTEEIKIAIQLINEYSTRFDPSKYRDTYSERLLKVIENKVKGKTIKLPTQKKVANKTVDLMEQLKASLKVKNAS